MTHYGICCNRIGYGFRSISGKSWPDAWVDTYNNYSSHIASIAGDSPMCFAERDAIADRRHQFFVQCDKLA